MVANVGRNDPCPCGSGKKYKRCCEGDQATSAGIVEAPMPSDPHQATHVLDQRLVHRIIEFGAQRFGRRFDPEGKFEDELGCDASDLQFFVPWIAYHYGVGGATLLDHYRQKMGRTLSAQEHAWLDAQRAARLSFWEITNVQPGETVSVRDLFTGDERVVTERAASQAVRVWDVLFARVADFGGASYFCGMRSRLLPPSEGAAAAKAVRRALRVRRKWIAAELITSQDGQGLLFSAWEQTLEAVDARPATPELRNTDGDRLRFTTDRFVTAPGSAGDVASRLRQLAGVEVGDNEGRLRLTFTKPGNRMNKSWENTILGHLEMTDDGFAIDTNSTKRANGLRRLVEAACGDMVEHVGREAKSAEQMMNTPHLVRPAKRTPAKALPFLREFKAKHYAQWLDDQVPALGGLTPRQAARDRRRRADVDVLLKDIERRESMLPAEEKFDVAPLRAELGL